LSRVHTKFLGEEAQTSEFSSKCDPGWNIQEVGKNPEFLRCCRGSGNDGRTL